MHYPSITKEFSFLFCVWERERKKSAICRCFSGKPKPHSPNYRSDKYGFSSSFSAYSFFLLLSSIRTLSSLLFFSTTKSTSSSFEEIIRSLSSARVSTDCMIRSSTAMGFSGTDHMKIVSGDAGYVLQDVPHLSDFIPDLPVSCLFLLYLFDSRGVKWRS